MRGNNTNIKSSFVPRDEGKPAFPPVGSKTTPVGFNPPIDLVPVKEKVKLALTTWNGSVPIEKVNPDKPNYLKYGLIAVGLFIVYKIIK